MPLLYYKDPADGQYKPYIPAGQDADAIMAAHEVAADPHTGYVKKSGDTMTGPLLISTESLLPVRLDTTTWAGSDALRVISSDGAEWRKAQAADPTGDNDLTTKRWVDNQKVSKSGDTMTGDLSINGNTTFTGAKLLLGLAGNKGSIRYAGRGVGFVLDDGDASGASQDRQNLIVADVPTRSDHATSKNYVDGSDVAISMASGFTNNGTHRNKIRVLGKNRQVVMHFNNTSQQTSTGFSYLVGTIPAGHRPADTYVQVPANIASGSPMTSCWAAVAVIYNTGDIRFVVSNGITVPANAAWTATFCYPAEF